MAKQSGLGRGIGALFGDNPVLPQSSAEVQAAQGALELKITDIDPNKDQPRKIFDDEKLAELAQSIKTSGIIQPLVVSRKGERYVIVAGERRWRAARLAGLTHVPVVVRNYAQDQLMEIALIENLQRDDLNPVEEASAIKMLMEQHALTQEEVAQRIGKSRSAIANTVRLLTLDERVLDMLVSGELTAGHARVLVAIENPDEQYRMAQKVRDENLSVRQTEEMGKTTAAKKKRDQKQRATAAEVANAQAELEKVMGTKVRIIGDERRGRIMIEYYSTEQLQNLYDYLIIR